MEQLVTTSPDVLDCIPVKTLMVYLSQGQTIDDFLDDFPSVRHEQVVRFLERVGAAATALTDENSA
jgi:uncharacterized protein (DUF433 family)